MAVNEQKQSVSAAGRRFFFGTNVLVLILLAAFVVVAVNYIGHKRNFRKDVAGGLTGSRLSERTKKILDSAGTDLRITTVYASDEPDTDRKKYFPKVRDLAEEIRQHNRKIKVENLHSGDERARLRSQVQQKFGSAAGKYEEVIALAEGTWTDFETAVAPLRKEMETILAGETWLGGFSTLANHARTLQKDEETLEQTRREVQDLVKGEGLPRYQEANNKIRSTNDDLKKHLEDLQRWMADMNKLVKALSDSNSEFAARTREKLNEQTALIAQLVQVAGDPKDASVPDDPKPILQEYARAANKMGVWLVEESGRVDAFVKQYPAMQRHPKWLVRTQQGPFVAEMQLSILLGQAAEDLTRTAQLLRQILVRNEPKDQLQNYVRQVRQLTAQLAEQLEIWKTNVLALFEESSKIDPNGSDAQFLARGEGEPFKAVLAKLNDVGTKITELPALKLDDIATRLQQENIIVIENEKDVRVVTFDEAWPVADPMASQFGGGEDEGGQRRVFAGDSAISTAVLSLQADKPVATVILVAYENDPPPQMRQFSRGRNTGPIPLDQLATLRERLEQANFKVKDWNLAGEGEAAARPQPEEGTQAIYLVLPPAPKQQPNFMMPQQQEKSFGAAEVAQVKEALSAGGRAIFLASFTPQMGPFAPPSEYEYGKLLSEDWGIEVKPEYRVIRGVVDRRVPDHYSINLMQWYYMQLNAFSKDNPIGEPLRSRRVLMREVCPLTVAANPPEGVKHSVILEVPESSVDTWAEKDIGRIIKALRSPDGGSFTRNDDALVPPFPVAISAVNEKADSRIVVLGGAMSIRDDYLTQRVMRIEGKQGRLMTDPPPTENADLMVNAMYWLGGKPDMIAAGPADVPIVPAMDNRSRMTVRVVAILWAVAVLVAGGAVMLVRRK